jgi:hypothetical protein
VLPPYIYNGYGESIPSDRCDWAYGRCKRRVDAILALPAHDSGSPLNAISERRPLCDVHLGLAIPSYSSLRGPYEVWPITDDDLCAILEERGTREHANADDLDLCPPSTARLHRGETI